MPRHLIREASSGRTRVVGSGALPFFPGWVVLDTLEDNQPATSFYDAAASDFRYVNVTELGDSASPARQALNGLFAPVPTSDADKEGFVPSRLADVSLKAALGAAESLAGVAGRKYRVVAGAVRNTDADPWWTTIEDTVHRSANVDAVTTTDQGVFVNFAALPVTKVVSFVAGVDETLAKGGFSCGASVTLSEARIELHHEKSVADYVSYSGSAWVSSNGAFTPVSYTAGVLTLNHESVGIGAFANTGYGGSVSSRGGAARAVFSSASSAISHNVTKVEFYDPAGTLLTTPTTDMKFVLTRQTSAKARVDPREVTEGRYPNGNIWFVGVFEVNDITTSGGLGAQALGTTPLGGGA